MLPAESQGRFLRVFRALRGQTFISFFLLSILLFTCCLSPAEAALPEDIKSRLDEIRRNLQISIATQERAVSELEALKQSGQATPEMLQDYEFYLNRVAAMTAQNRKALGEMQALCDRYTSMAAPTDTSVIEGAPVDEEIVDESVRLERQLNESLAAFDDMLLTEQDALTRKLEEIRAKTDAQMEGLAEEAEEAAGRLREQGVDVEGEDSSTGEGGEAGTDDETRSGGEAEESGDTSGEKGGESGEEIGGEPGKTDEGKGKGGGDRRKGPATSDDDDIVARQLREAAEKETDPELKEKLWEEYEAYKKGQSRSSQQ
jgi:hypothetical protein